MTKGLVAAVLAVIVAGAAMAQDAPQRAAIPLPKPVLAGVGAQDAASRETREDTATRDALDDAACKVPSPELHWARLPRELREVPVREMIGQLLVASYSGQTPTSEGVLGARALLSASKIGGVLTFRHNIASGEDIAAINALFAKAHPLLPAFVAVDQEGGAVSRVKPSEGAPQTPSARDVAGGSVAQARTTYDAMAKALANLGFTVNFGPVVDLEVEPDNPVIAGFGRSYGADVDRVVAYARAFIDAHHAAGVATALKHFPGHGSTTADSHEGAIDLTPTWTREELAPFAKLIAMRDVDMVMIGHLKLDGMGGAAGLPASISKEAITDVLRDALCFDGLVITDDLAMDAISKHFDPAGAAERLIDAGGDLILVSLGADGGGDVLGAITERLAAKAEASTKFADLIRYAYARVVNHKLDLAARAASADRAEQLARVR